MSIIKRDPFREIERFFDEDDIFGFFPAIRRHFNPALNVYETENNVVVEIYIPELDINKVSATIKDSILRIEGADSQEKEEQKKNYYRKEIRTGNFVRTVALPVAVKEEEAQAHYENGKLKIEIPKEEVRQPKQIEIKIK